MGFLVWVGLCGLCLGCDLGGFVLLWRLRCVLVGLFNRMLLADLLLLGLCCALVSVFLGVGWCIHNGLHLLSCVLGCLFLHDCVCGWLLFWLFAWS